MALKVWIGGAPVRRNKWTITIGGTWDDAGEVDIVCTIGNASLTLSLTKTAGTADTDEIAENLEAMLSGSTLPGGSTLTCSANGAGDDIGEFAECDFSVAGSVVTLTGPEDGAPVSLNVTTDSVNGTAVEAETVTAEGPHDFDVGANWLGGTAPSSGDDLLFDYRAISGVKYGLDQSYDAYDSLIVQEGYRYEIGLPPLAGTLRQYPEYRDRFLQIRPAVTDIFGGSGACNIDQGTAAAIVLTVNRPTQFLNINQPTVNFLGGHADTEIQVYSGDVGIGLEGAVTCKHLRVGSEGQATGATMVYVGTGVTLGTSVMVQGGTLENRANMPALTMTGGLVRHLEGTLASGIINRGTLDYRSSGTMTAGRISRGAVIDFSRENRSRTVTDLTLTAGAGYRDPQGTVTHTNGIDLYGCRPSDLSVFDIPIHRTLTLTSI